MIYGFSIVHLVVPTVTIGLILPSWFNWTIPKARIPEGDKRVAPMETFDRLNGITRDAASEESGSPPAYKETKH